VSMVLVVDDERPLLRALGVHLRARGYEVDLVETGEAAIARCATGHHDAAIVDLGLPGIDGIEVVKGLRGWTSIPIIVLSARQQHTQKVEALDAGADDYVTKPFNMEELLARSDGPVPIRIRCRWSRRRISGSTWSPSGWC